MYEWLREGDSQRQSGNNFKIHHNVQHKAYSSLKCKIISSHMNVNKHSLFTYFAEDITTEFWLECRILVRCVATLFSNVSMLSRSCLYC